MSNSTTISQQVTTTVTQTTGITSTFTVNHTTTEQLSPATIFGFPPEIFAILVIAMSVVVILYFRLQVRGIPDVLTWIYKTGSALRFNVQKDLNGIFINVLSGRRKTLETLTKGAEPLEVTLLPNKVEFYIKPEDKGDVMDEETTQYLKDKGFTIEPKTRGKKNTVKGYLVYNELKLRKALAYLDVSLGGLRHVKEYFTIEGSGTTIDWTEKAKDAPTEGKGKAGVLHEEMNAGKNWLHHLADAAKGTWATLLLPFLAGGGIIGMSVLLVMLLTGHFR